jgi:hypothetical protein
MEWKTKNRKWHAWFAWHPVFVDEERFHRVWLSWVLRRWKGSSYGGYWEHTKFEGV